MAEEERVRTQEREAGDPRVQTPTAAPLEVPRVETPADTPSRTAPQEEGKWLKFWLWFQGFWFFEVWYRIRPILIELTVHALIFGMLFGSLVLFHYINERGKLSSGQNEVLDKVHFYGTISALVIFTISFIIKAFKLEARGKHDD